jgi:xanthine dehydrogenase YagS FAD-binding subunit
MNPFQYTRAEDVGTATKSVASEPTAAFLAGVPLGQFYISYGDDPAKENVLERGEFITAVDVPHSPMAAKSHYLKVRDRASYEFAMTSAAVAIDFGATIKNVRVVLGGVGTKSWRSTEAEAALVGRPPADAVFEAAADAALAAAKPHKDNAFKVELSRPTLVPALQTVNKSG